MRTTKNFKESERRELKKIVYEKTGYYIRGNCLFIQAFTRRSHSVDYGGENGEILEFIGDCVLDYYVVKIIAEQYGALNSNCEYTFRIRENRFTKLKQELVNNKTLARIIDEWGIAQYLIVGKSDIANSIDEQEKVKADLFEAILCAVAVASKWEPHVLETAVRRMLSLDDLLKNIRETDYRPEYCNIENAVNTLKELAEHGRCSVPTYRYGTPKDLGYEKNGNPIWICTCSVINDKTGITKLVQTSSKKMAKKCAAYLVLCDHFELQNEYGVNGKYIAWTYKDGKLMPGT